MIFLLSLINVLSAMGVLLWPLALFSSIFFFDAPGATESPLTIGLAIAVMSYPIPAIVGNILYWRNKSASTMRQKSLQTLISSSGYIVIAVLVVLLVMVCDGKFACR